MTAFIEADEPDLVPPIIIIGVARGVRAPVVVLREYMETVLSTLTAYANAPSGEIRMGDIPDADPVPIGTVDVERAPVVVLRLYMEMVASL